MLAGAPDGPDGFDDPDADAWLATATVDGQPYLQPDPALRPRVPADFGHVRRDDVRDDVEWLVATMAAGGLHTLVLDQTRPDVGMPVVKVVVPGLRPFWARFAAGRLYDVPVRQGRLAVPTGYHDLNPLPLFL